MSFELSKICATLLIIRAIQIKTTLPYPFSFLFDWKKIKKPDSCQKQTLSYIDDGNVTLMEEIWQYLIHPHMHLPVDTVIPPIHD